MTHCIYIESNRVCSSVKCDDVQYESVVCGSVPCDNAQYDSVVCDGAFVHKLLIF